MATTNRKYLKENGLEKAHEHFMRLAEAYFPYEEELQEGPQDEQDPNMGADPSQQGAMPPMDGGQGGGMPPMDGSDPNMGGGDPSQMPPQDGSMPPMDPSQGGDPSQQGAMPPMDGAGMPPMGDEPPMDEPKEDDGETIDIDGLTKAETKISDKQNQIGSDLSKVDNRIINLMDKLEKFQDAIDKNNTELDALKAEFEKRNPTQTEKLRIRSADGYPFNQFPTDYWKDKTANSNYSVDFDNSTPTTKEYTITNDDVDDVANDIADTFFDIDDDDKQTMSKLFRGFA